MGTKHGDSHQSINKGDVQCGVYLRACAWVDRGFLVAVLNSSKADKAEIAKRNDYTEAAASGKAASPNHVHAETIALPTAANCKQRERKQQPN